MPATARDIFERVQALTKDALGVRWPIAELVDWLNDGCRELVLHKPSAVAALEAHALSAGTRQELATTAVQLLGVPRNTAGRAIRRVSREVLDAQAPDWHSATAVDAVKHVVLEPEDPRGFYVYPPNTGQGSVDVLLAHEPAPISGGTTLADFDAVTLPVPDIYVSALADYVLYRVFSKDMAEPGNAQRAGAHYQAFASAIGVKATQEASRDA